jgi:hypothetical protein
MWLLGEECLQKEGRKKEGMYLGIYTRFHRDKRIYLISGAGGWSPSKSCIVGNILASLKSLGAVHP